MTSFASATNKLLLRRYASSSSSSSSQQAKAVARVLLVGSGRMGRIRAKAIYSNPRFEFVGIVDSNVERAAELGEIYRAPHYQSLSEAIKTSSSSSSSSNHSSSSSSSSSHPPPLIDGIIISTPTPTHESLIAEAAHNGISIFTEKPVDETASKIRRLFDAARRHDVNLCCGFQRRFDPAYLSLYHQVNGNNGSGNNNGNNITSSSDNNHSNNDMLSNNNNNSNNSGIIIGSIGTPLTASIFFGDHPPPPRSFLLQGGGNIISDCSAHDVDYVRWALGRDEVESVYATGTSSDEELRERGVIDNATMVLKFARGTVVTITLSRAASYGYDQRCEIFGTRGLASVRNQPADSSELADAAGVRRPGWRHSFPQRFGTAFDNEMDAFADTLLSGVPWTVTEGDCVAVQRVCDAALESCESGEVVRLMNQ